MSLYPRGPHGSEMAGLVAWLEFHQVALLRKIEGLTEEQLRWSPVGSGTNLLGLVKHLAYAHNRWFQVCLLGEAPGVPVIDRADEFVAAAGERANEIVALYRQEIDRSHVLVRSLGPDELNKGGHPNGRWGPGDFDVRWVLLHVIEEVARHNGHADILRELIDGGTGR